MTRQKSQQPQRSNPFPGTQTQQQHNNAVISAQWEGPLPPPGALQQFDAIIPDGANRIMVMVEEEQRHRHKHEDEALNAAISDTKRGHWIGAGISIVCVIGAVATAIAGAHPTVSIALVGYPVVAMIKAVLRDRSPAPPAKED